MTIRAETSGFAAYQPQVIAPRTPAQSPERVEPEPSATSSDHDPLFDQLYNQEDDRPQSRPWDFDTPAPPSDLWGETVKALRVDPTIPPDPARRLRDALLLFGNAKQRNGKEPILNVPENFDQIVLGDPPIWRAAMAAYLQRRGQQPAKDHSAADSASPESSPPVLDDQASSDRPGPV
jgi:hypothetical protein